MVLSIPVHEIFLNLDFFHLSVIYYKITMYRVIQNISCQTGFSTMNMRFDKIFCDEETQFMQDMSQAHTNTHTIRLPQAHTHTEDHMVTDLLTVISATSAFSTVGQQMLLDNR